MSLRKSLSRRHLAALAAGFAAAGAAGLSAIPAQAATAATAGPAAASCTDSYVEASLPLTDLSTGVTLPFSDGYVQLWYNGCNQSNFAHAVSELPGTTSVRAEVFRSDGAYAYETSTGGLRCSVVCSGPVASPTAANVYSPQLYSPIDTDSAVATVVANGVTYLAQTLYY
jgi:hypothetical protein